MDYKEIETLAQQVTFFLNAGGKKEAWTFKPNAEPYPTQHIKGPGEAELYLNLGQYGVDKGKVSISGSLFIGKNRQYWTVYSNCQRLNVPTISVTVARGAEVIAKEIKRRLLPDYLRILGIAINQRDAQVAHQNKRRNNLVHLAKLVNASVPEGDDVSSTSFYRTDAAYGKIQTSDKTASLDLHNLTLQQAHDILAYVQSGATWEAKQVGEPEHPETDEHRAGCPHCQYVYDSKLSNA